MYRYGLDQETAFQVMRRLSSHQNIKLRDIAARVIDEFQRDRHDRLSGRTAAPRKPVAGRG